MIMSLIFDAVGRPSLLVISDIGAYPYLGSPTTALTPAFIARWRRSISVLFRVGRKAKPLQCNGPRIQPWKRILRSETVKCLPSFRILAAADLILFRRRAICEKELLCNYYVIIM